MPEFTSVEIDEPEDWVIAESIMKKHSPERLQYNGGHSPEWKIGDRKKEGFDG